MFLKEFLKAPEVFLILSGRSSENNGYLRVLAPPSNFTCRQFGKLT